MSGTHIIISNNLCNNIQINIDHSNCGLYLLDLYLISHVIISDNIRIT